MSTPELIRSTRQQISDLLRQDIVSGRLAAGARISEADLAERFGVSRGPIREALAQLTSEGLFVAKPNCGVTVAPPAPEAIHELVLPIRRTLETYALRQIFDELTPADFRLWDDILFRMERACRQREIQEFPQLDVVLHRSILERAGQPDLLAIWQTIVTRMRQFYWTTVERYAARDELLQMHANHVTLIEAFRGGDKQAALDALEAHIANN